VTRNAADVGAGLAPARAARLIEPGTRLHVLGVAGAGASAAALLARHAGATVDGCDPGGPSPYTPPLQAAGIELAWAHDPAHLVGPSAPTRVAVTKALTAVEPDHPELVAARRRAIVLEPWQQVVADAAVGRRLVAVAGTHGKSTTAGWLVHALVTAGADPSAFVGALLPGALTGGIPATARWGRGPAFVVEADEYAGNFDPYRPSVAVLTSAEWDHPDVFADRSAVVAAFAAWLRAAATVAAEPPMVVANVGDPGVVAVLDALRDTPIEVIATRVEPAGTAADPAGESDRPIAAAGLAARHATDVGPATVLVARIVDAGPDGTAVVIERPGATGVELRLATAGRHNVSNALGVVGALVALGIPLAGAAPALAGFAGVGRRLERKGEAGGVVVYDDYGHHPTAIRETLAAVRQREPGRRVWAVYEPLTYHRTAAMLDDFAEVLATADAVAIADIWAGRDQDTTVASAAGLAAAVATRRPGIPVEAPGPVEATADRLAGAVRRGDVVLVMGGGHSYRIGERLLERLGARP
jgi:UDP-N-acetylmuramate--alanine ligase